VAVRQLALKRDDVCAACGERVAAGERATWDSSMKRVTCLDCHPASARPAAAAAVEASASHDHDHDGAAAAAADVGRPGASAQREYERRRMNRIEETHARHPRIGGLLLAVRSAPQHEVAFRSGAEGEREEARTASSPALFLHDRRMPQERGNIDHLAITASGVYVIDAKNHKAGKVRIENPLFGKARLVIDGRDHTRLIDGLDRQVAAVSAHLASAQIDVPVVGVLCFTKADLPLLGTMKMRSHLVLYPKAAAKRINAPGPLGETQIRDLAAMLAGALPPA